MTVFREDTTFPFLKLAREENVPYEKVMHIAEIIWNGATPTGPSEHDKLLMKIARVVGAERNRRISICRA